MRSSVKNIILRLMLWTGLVRLFQFVIVSRLILMIRRYGQPCQASVETFASAVSGKLERVSAVSKGITLLSLTDADM